MRPAITFRPDGSAVILSTTPAACACKRMAVLFVNRGGTTVCVECDAHREAKP